MRIFTLLCASLCFCLAVFYNVGAYAQSPHGVVLITNDAFSFNAKRIAKFNVTEQYNVDDLKRLEIELNNNLPNNETEARIVAEERLPVYQEKLANAFRGALLVGRWDLKHLPAIIFENGKYVYYGTDIEHAQKLYNQSIGQ